MPMSTDIICVINANQTTKMSRTSLYVFNNVYKHSITHIHSVGKKCLHFVAAAVAVVVDALGVSMASQPAIVQAKWALSVALLLIDLLYDLHVIEHCARVHGKTPPIFRCICIYAQQQQRQQQHCVVLHTSITCIYYFCKLIHSSLAHTQSWRNAYMHRHQAHTCSTYTKCREDV